MVSSQQYWSVTELDSTIIYQSNNSYILYHEYFIYTNKIYMVPIIIILIPFKCPCGLFEELTILESLKSR